MVEDWIDASRMTFRVAKDRTTFLLTVESLQRPPVHIRFPLSFGPNLLDQLRNMLDTAGVALGRTPDSEVKH